MAGALTLEAAERVVAACQKRAEELGQSTPGSSTSASRPTR